jgi:PP-loop superfamily ATP-utilizing enzyme
MGNPKSEIRNPNFGAEHSQPTPQNPKQYLARIEVGQDELPRLLDGETRERISEELTRIGYAHVTVDLQGYRRGSLNAALPAQAKVGKT